MKSNNINEHADKEMNVAETSDSQDASEMKKEEGMSAAKTMTNEKTSEKHEYAAK